MEVTATDVNGYTEKKSTPVIGGTNNPTWNDYLVFSERTWEEVKANIFDWDGSGRKPDRLCPVVRLTRYTLERKREFISGCYPGKAVIQFIIE